MDGSWGETGLRRLTPLQARAVLAVALAAMLLFVGVALSPLANRFAESSDHGPSDIELYHAEIARIHAGASYYDAAATELTARGYPTRTVLNWRTPLLATALGFLPNATCGRFALALLAAVVLLAACHLLMKQGQVRRGLLCGALMIAGLLPCFLPGLYVMHELWAGALIAASVIAYGLKRPAWGVAAGAAALFIRELAAPYCGLCLLLAIAGRRRGETIAWIWVLAAYSAAYAMHVEQVLPRITPNATIGASWLALGGAAFVISAVQMNGILLIVPQWISGVYLVAAGLGFAAARTDWEKRAALAAAGYLAMFAIVGLPCNQYWGSLIAPLLCLGASAAPAALRDLIRAAKLSRHVYVSDVAPTSGGVA